MLLMVAAEGVMEATEGAVRSMVTAADAWAVTGDALPASSATAPAAISGATVPSEQLPAVTVTEVPDAADTPKVQPVAVPVLVMSDEARPLMGSPNASVNGCDEEFVGVAGGVQVAVVGVRSIVVVAPSRLVAGPVLPAPSETASASRRGMSVPSEQAVTTTSIEVPVDADGVNTQPVAVPWFVKSAAVMPTTCSANDSG